MKLNSLDRSNSRRLSSIQPLISSWNTNATIAEDFLDTDFDNYYNQELVCFDTETKGFKDEIIEIGAIIIKGNKIKNKDGNFYPYEYYMENNAEKKLEMDAFGYFVYPVVPEIPEFITELTSIDMETIEAGLKPYAKDPNRTMPNFSTALNGFIDYIDGRPLVAHNAVFDCGIFKWSMNKHSYEINKALADYENPLTLEKIEEFFSLKVYDTLAEAKKAFTLNPNINYKNSELAAFFGLESNEHLLHRAIYDVIFTSRNYYGLYEYVGNTYKNLFNMK